MHTPKLLVLASTYAARIGDGTPRFVRDQATVEALSYKTTVLVPSVPGGARREVDGALEVHRFRYFPRRWEDLADAAILENLHGRKGRWAQVLPLFLAEALATELGRLLRDPHLCAVLGRAAVTRAENFSVDAIGGRYVALLDEVRVRKKGETAGLLAPS